MSSTVQDLAIRAHVKCAELFHCPSYADPQKSCSDPKIHEKIAAMLREVLGNGYKLEHVEVDVSD